MTIYSFHLFDRNCEPIFTRTFHPSSHSLSPSDFSKLLFGTLFSLRNLSKKLTPDSNTQMFTYKTNLYAIHVFETLTLLRFVMMTSPDLMKWEMEPILRQIYATLYVPYIAKNPASLECLYSQTQLDQYRIMRFGESGQGQQMGKRERKRQVEMEKREAGELGDARRGMGMVVGCELFAMALDQFIGSLPGYQQTIQKH